MMKKNWDMDERVDVRSARFDPRFALSSTDVALPIQVFPLQNMYAARSLLPTNHPDYLARRIMDPTRILEDKDIARRMARNESIRDERRNKRNVISINPLIPLMNGVTSEPFSMLRQAVNDTSLVKVYIRRIDGVRGTCTGYVKAFDRTLNLLMFDIDEEYTCYEYKYVSSDGYKSDTAHKVEKFLKVYNPEKADNATPISIKYRGKEKQLWEFMHDKYGLTERVSAHLDTGSLTPDELKTKAQTMLYSYAGKESILMVRLGIANENENRLVTDNQRDSSDCNQVVIHAEWVRTESAKHAGRFFYFNTVTNNTSWKPPENIKFKTLKYLVKRRRHLNQTLIRGDCVIMCSK